MHDTIYFATTEIGFYLTFDGFMDPSYRLIPVQT